MTRTSLHKINHVDKDLALWVGQWTEVWVATGKADYNVKRLENFALHRAIATTLNKMFLMKSYCRLSFTCNYMRVVCVPLQE
jgi:hypothetical protein